MGIDNNIQNPIVGWAWLLGGMGVASAWLGPKIRALRDLGFWGYLKAKTDSPEERRFMDVQARIFLFFVAWLGLYLILDFFF